MKLSILICTMPQRAEMFNTLLEKLNRQVENDAKGKVEILSNDRIDITTGHKRNLLIQDSQGDFVVFVDDDDDVYEWYVKDIIETIEKNPNVDCIGTNGIISFDGKNPKKWFISIKYLHWYEANNVYYRTPNHISPIRRSIAITVPFPDLYRSEDSAFSAQIFPLLKNEAIIERPLYHYRFAAPAPKHTENGEPYRPAWR